MTIVSSAVRLLAAAAIGVSAFSSQAAVTFTADETPYGGGLVDAQRINGGYTEVITFDGLGGFDTAAAATFSQFFNLGDPNPLTAAIGSTYTLYAIFTASGSVIPLGGGLTSFAGTGGSFTLYLDGNKDTVLTLGATGNDAVTRSGGLGDDLELASATSLEAGTGVLVPNIGGFFDLIFDDFTLTDDGKDYFVAPTPFSLRVNVDGDFDNFLTQGTQRIDGDVSAQFLVPEPGSLILAGLALLGLGVSSNRRKV
jgi:hypothetical protein